MTGMKLLKEIFTKEAHDNDMYVRISREAMDLICKQIESDKMFHHTTREIILPIKSCEIDRGETFLTLETDDDMPF